MTDAAPFNDDEQEKPLDPAAERVRRKLVRFMVINIAILMAALMAVVVALVYKGTQETQTAAGAPAASVPDGAEPLSTTLRLGAGETALSHTLDGARLSVLVEGPDGARAVLVFDAQSGRLLARHALVAP